MTPLRPLIDAANSGDIITVPDGEYDDATPIVIEKSVGLIGSRNALVHSEFMVRNGAQFSMTGLTLNMNKTGAPSRTGKGYPFPQNGLITVVGATFWGDDLNITTAPGFAKDAIYVIHGNLNLRTVTEFARVDWRGNTGMVIELLYGSYGNIFDVSGQGIGLGLSAQTAAATGAAINVVGSKLTMSGCAMWNFGTNQVGVSLARFSRLMVGAGLYTSINGFTNPHLCDATENAVWIQPGNIG